MQILIDTINETTLKALAKRYLKVLQEKDPNTKQTLMSVQEDLVRAVGHADMHSAQGYWAKQATQPAGKAEAPVASPFPKAVWDAAEVVVNERFNSLASRVGYFDRDTLRDHIYWGTRQAVGEKIFDEEQIDLPAFKAMTQALQDRLPLVPSDTQANFFTAPSWIQARETLIRKAPNRHTRAPTPEVVEADLFKTKLNEEGRGAVQNICLSEKVISILDAAPNTTSKNSALTAIKAAFLHSGFEVVGVGPTWDDTDAVAKTLKLDCTKFFMLSALLKGLEEAKTKGQRFFQMPTLIVVENAGEVDFLKLTQLVEAAGSRETAQVKLLLVSDKRKPYSAVECLGKELGVSVLDSARKWPTPKPYDAALRDLMGSGYPHMVESVQTEDGKIYPNKKGVVQSTFHYLAFHLAEQNDGEQAFYNRCYQILNAYNSEGSPLQKQSNRHRAVGPEMAMEVKQILIDVLDKQPNLSEERKALAADIISGHDLKRKDRRYHLPAPFVMDWAPYAAKMRADLEARRPKGPR